jgi:RecA/RadA recombinase
MCKQALDKSPESEVVIIDTEFAFNKKWAQDLGIDPSRIRLIQETNASQIATMLCGKWNDKGKKTIPGILDLIISGELNVKLIVLDSVADLQPPAEIGRGFDEYEMASLARFLPKFMRVLKPQLARAQVGMIMINHLKVSMTGGPDTYSGGVALKHNCDYVIKIHASTSAENTLLDANDRKIGHKILCTVEKSRGGANKRQAETFINFYKGVVRIGEEVATLGDLYGVVSRPNLQMWQYKEHSIRGKDAFYEFLDSNPDIMDEILEEVRALQANGADVSFPVSADDATDESESEE